MRTEAWIVLCAVFAIAAYGYSELSATGALAGVGGGVGCGGQLMSVAAAAVAAVRPADGGDG